MTEKLYYIDAYTKEFDATVTSVKAEGYFYLVTLDRTAFFPTEGGQSADTGTLAGNRVLDVTERDGEIIHKLDGVVAVGDKVHGVIDFDARFEKMQCHTAEHILCGIIHNLYGYNNVGFHLGDIVTFDIDSMLTREQLSEVELLANRAVFDNLEVKAEFPSPDVLRTMSYRSKLDIYENVRIVKIGDIDSCACCAPHVSRTGEIGLIKLLNSESHRGGVRIYMVAGYRALTDYNYRLNEERKISAILSVPQGSLANGVEEQNALLESARATIKSMLLSSARREAEALPETEGNVVKYFPDMNMDALREFSKCSSGKVSGILVSLCGEEGDYKYVISSEQVNLREIVSDMNTALCGKGGGRAEMLQGSFSASLSEIEEYFGK